MKEIIVYENLIEAKNEESDDIRDVSNNILIEVGGLVEPSNSNC